MKAIFVFLEYTVLTGTAHKSHSKNSLQGPFTWSVKKPIIESSVAGTHKDGDIMLNPAGKGGM